MRSGSARGVRPSDPRGGGASRRRRTSAQARRRGLRPHASLRSRADAWCAHLPRPRLRRSHAAARPSAWAGRPPRRSGSSAPTVEQVSVSDEALLPETARAVVLVRNTVTHDARVQRAAGTLARLGLDPLVIGVMSDAEREARTGFDGIPVVRLDPRSPFTALRRLRRRAAPTAGTKAAAAAPQAR